MAETKHDAKATTLALPRRLQLRRHPLPGNAALPHRLYLPLSPLSEAHGQRL